jgi:hypothetical protein
MTVPGPAPGYKATFTNHLAAGKIILASVLTGMAEVPEELTPDHFSDRVHKIVFEGILAVQGQGLPMDQVARQIFERLPDAYTQIATIINSDVVRTSDLHSTGYVGTLLKDFALRKIKALLSADIPDLAAIAEVAAEEAAAGASLGRPKRLTKEALKLYSYSMVEEKDIEFEKMYPILGFWLLSGSINMIHGPAGKGKTWAVLGCGLTLATAVSFVPGWEAHSEPLKVLMVDGEMSPDQLRERKYDLIAGCSESFDHALLENLCTISNIHLSSKGLPFLDLTQAQDRKNLEDYILEEGFRVVFLDNLSCLIPGINIKLSEEISPFLMWLRSLIAKGVTVIFVHHDNKSDDFTGANEMTFPLQTRLHVRGDGSGFKVDYPKFRHGSKPVSERFAIRSFQGGLAITTGAEKVGTIIDDAVAYIVECNGRANRFDVIDHLESLGYDRESARKKISSEVKKEKGRFQEVENVLTTI